MALTCPVALTLQIGRRLRRAWAASVGPMFPCAMTSWLAECERAHVSSVSAASRSLAEGGRLSYGRAILQAL